MMNSTCIIERLKITYGNNLENLSIEDRYAAIALLAVAICKQKFIFQLFAESVDFEKLYRNCQATKFIYDTHVTAMPGIIKFLSETIPGSF